MEKKSFLLRINTEMWNELEAWAQQEFRSVNGQIEYVLKQALNARRGSKEIDRDNSRAENPTSPKKWTVPD